MTLNKYEPNGRLCRVVEHGDTLYLSGVTAPADCEGVVAQTECVLAKIEELLKTYGSEKGKLLAATLYLKNAEDAPAMNKVWNDFFADTLPPTRTCILAPLVAEHVLIEITVIAAK